MGEPEPEACPCENNIPPTSPGPVEDQEVVVRFVEDQGHIGADASGKVFLVPTAIRKDDIQGKKGRSLSLAREAYAERDDLERRAAARAEEKWRQNPILALTHARQLRAILDGAQRREVCVNSDPLTDDLGTFPAHASAVRSDPPKDDQLRQHWLQLRTAVGECFDDIRHADGNPATVKTQV
jgi:hypothetical protein